MELWGFQEAAPMVVPISDWFCRYFGVSPQPPPDKCLQCGIKRDLPFYMGGKELKAWDQSPWKRIEHSIGRGSLSFSVYEIQET